jgi:F0F1-type ATP synthase assembly protein I
VSNAMITQLDGPDVEQDIALDMVKRALPVLPVVLLLTFAIWGWHGAASAGVGAGLVLLNFLVAAALLGWAARISLGMLMGAALFGFLIRLALISIAIYVVKDLSWVELVPLCLTLVITHLGLLVWETRYVSASLAFPGLKPDAKRSAKTSVSDELDHDPTTPPEVKTT